MTVSYYSPNNYYSDLIKEALSLIEEHFTIKLYIKELISDKMIKWCEDNFGPDACVFLLSDTSTDKIKINPQANWTWLGYNIYFRNIDHLILFKLLFL